MLDTITGFPRKQNVKTKEKLVAVELACYVKIQNTLPGC